MESVLRTFFSLILFVQADFSQKAIASLATIGIICGILAPILISQLPSVVSIIPRTMLFLDPFQNLGYEKLKNEIRVTVHVHHKFIIY